VTDHHGLDPELLEGFSFAVHLHRLLAAEDSAEMPDENEQGGFLLRDLGERNFFAVEILHHQIAHITALPA
jgi:hypothetical protein